MFQSMLIPGPIVRLIGVHELVRAAQLMRVLPNANLAPFRH